MPYYLLCERKRNQKEETEARKYEFDFGGPIYLEV